MRRLLGSAQCINSSVLVNKIQFMSRIVSGLFKLSPFIKTGPCRFAADCMARTKRVLHSQVPEQKPAELIILDDSSNNSELPSDHLWIEEYFYATRDGQDNEKAEKKPAKVPLFMELAFSDSASSMFICHICYLLFDSVSFSSHCMNHADQMVGQLAYHEKNHPKGNVECRHCFKILQENQLATHTSLLKETSRPRPISCHICCIEFGDTERFTKHMFQCHHKHDTPYHCPTCKFSSSFQLDIYNHFRDKHGHLVSVLCLSCLKEFSVGALDKANASEMLLLSRKFHNHILDHYEFSRMFTCNRCCLAFTSGKDLNRHKRKHHNRLIGPNQDIQPFKVTEEIQAFCTRFQGTDDNLESNLSSSTEEDVPLTLQRSKRFHLKLTIDTVSGQPKSPKASESSKINYPQSTSLDHIESSDDEAKALVTPQQKRKYRPRLLSNQPKTCRFITPCGLDYSGPFVEFHKETMSLESIIMTETGPKFAFIVKLQGVKDRAFRMWPSDAMAADAKMVREFIHQSQVSFHGKRWSRMHQKLQLNKTILNNNISDNEVVKRLRKIEDNEVSEYNTKMREKKRKMRQNHHTTLGAESSVKVVNPNRPKL